MILTRELIEAWNARARARGLEVSAVDKLALAALLQVSLRTVQRWFAPPGAQYRRLIPLSVVDMDFVQIHDARLRLRVVLGALLADQHERFCGRCRICKEVEAEFATLADCLVFADALAEGLAPIWLVCNWRVNYVRRAGLAWRQVVVYEGERREKRRGIEGAYRAQEPPPPEEPPPRRAPCTPDADCPGDDLRRECCILKTREECCETR